MKPLTASELRVLLAAEGFDPGAFATALPESPSPWFVRVLVGLGAWISGMVIGGSILVLLNFHEGPGAIAAGLLLCAAACVLRGTTRGDFPGQLALAGSLAGQLMALWGLMTLHDAVLGARAALGAMAFLELALLFLFRSAVHRFLSTAGAALCLAFLLQESGQPWILAPILGTALLVWGGIPPVLWSARTAPYRRPVLYGLAVVFFSTYFQLFFTRHGEASLHVRPDQVLAALAPGILLALAALRILGRLGRRLTLLAALVLLIMALAGFLAPGVPGTLLVLLLAVEAREPALAILAATAGAVFLGHLYYDVEATLLLKSGILVDSGAALLALRHWTGRRGKRC